jgi:TonB-linked SusC/RagA family outer membrane protein
MFLLVLFMATAAFSQQKKVTLSLKNVTVKTALEALKAQSGLSYWINANDVDMQKVISVNLKSKTVEDALKAILKGQDVRYQLSGDHIVISKASRVAEPKQETNSPQTEEMRQLIGKVTDDKGQALPGVTIVVKGTATGTITNVDGNYSFPKVSPDETLVFSFVGMQSQEVSIGNKDVINVALSESNTSLNEVVVVGYGTAKKRDIVGSIASINSKDLMVDPAYTDFNELLQGKASGVYVTDDGIRIRGMNSISNSTEPLYVIDGVISGNIGDLLNPSDIKSIDILKDAAATSIYGSRASNGVIIITTKSGDTGSNSFNVQVNTGIDEYVTDGFGTANTTTQLAAMDLAIQNSHKYDPTVPNVPYDPKDAFTYNVLFLTDANGKASNFDYFTRAYIASNNINTDALKAVERNGSYKEANLSTSKSFDNGKEGLFFSLNYRYTNGDVEGAFGDKLISRFGLNFAPLKNLKIRVNSTAAYIKNTAGTTITDDRWLPFMPLYDPTDPTGYWMPGANPLAHGIHNYVDDYTTSSRLSTDLYGEYDIPYVQGLSIRTTLDYDYSIGGTNNWSSSIMNGGPNGKPVSLANASYTIGQSELGDFGLNYDRTFGNHSFSAVLLEEIQKGVSNYIDVNAQNLTTTYHEVGTTPGTILSAGAGLSDESASISTLGRLDYRFKERYMLEASVRRDATSAFSPDKQSATFASVGAGWIVSDESFFKNSINWMNLLKLRGSYGTTGNASMPSYAYMNTYNIALSYMNLPYTYINNIGNPDASWETSINTDIGFDFGFLENKINGSLAYYDKNVNNLLLQVPLPLSAGIFGNNSIWQNIGDMSNKGIELNINYVPIRTTDFSWNLSFNFTNNKNEVNSLYPDLDNNGAGIQGTNSPTITRKGGKLAEFYIPEYAGIDPQKGIPMIYAINQTVYAETGNTVKTGELIPLNSETGTANRMIQTGKSSMPDWYGGFTNNFRYKNLDFSFMLSYAGSFYFLNYAAWEGREVGFGYTRLNSDIITNSWKKPGDIAKYPELIFGGGNYYNSAGSLSNTLVPEYSGSGSLGGMTTEDLVNGTYLKIKYITLGYTLPKALDSKIGIKNLRLSGTINNFLTFSKSPKAIDPEMSIPSNLEGNVAWYGLPPTRTLSFSLSIDF